MGQTILIAEDDMDIVELLSLYLSGEGYRILSAVDGQQALALMETQKVDLAILDIMMPGMNGYDLLREIRKHWNLPVLILSAKDLDTDKILGLNLGADAYITKPFHPLEVVAYVKAALRRYCQLGGEGEGGEAPGRVYTKAQLYACIGGALYESDENTMMVHISNLRAKVEDDPSHPKYIKTVRGLGYKIEET